MILPIFVGLSTAAMAGPVCPAPPGRFSPKEIRVRNAGECEALTSALSAMHQLLADPLFIDLITERNDLLTLCGENSSILDTAAFVHAWTTAELSPPEGAVAGTFTQLERLYTKRWTTSTGNGRIGITHGHDGLRSSGGVHGELLNTIVHEWTHLARRPSSSLDFWVEDRCTSGANQLEFRPLAASYQIGNTAQCFWWARTTHGCHDWLMPYESCMSAGVDDVGNVVHSPSARAMSAALPTCTAESAIPE